MGSAKKESKASAKETDPDKGWKWRKRHHIAFYGLAGGSPALSAICAIFVVAEHFDLPGYAWVPTFLLLLFEAIYVGSGVTLIELKKLGKSHKDLGIILLPVWTAGLLANVVFLLGAYSSGSTGATLYGLTFLIILSELTGMACCVMSIQQHILNLFNPHADDKVQHHKHHEDVSDGSTDDESPGKSGTEESDDAEEGDDAEESTDDNKRR